ncbi:uncharacterized protein K460DRAFT_419443 [Cucurbitaria berberidis CBS 394.84]|uniref:Uncharacterized protein n=1 Tax=Cucurbitaria berberidis CBS 394.84 TaxID=1168544 RepID=A0A9P4L4X0_9PLEO|nr:uncharacterized protein K460DRAFT_419443 [Cucurbitaria berberidis CBS 394.84]KAF1841373.1 hypothetical protein K460DRAFT_419443 [Cucurbitaria berberidis CBS 394.84]
MASNRVVNSKLLGTVLKGGKQVALAVATETDLWTRPESAVMTSAPDFRKAVEKNTDPLPAGTTKVIMREGEHSSKGDPKNHYTAVCENARGDYLKTIHIEKQD